MIFNYVLPYIYSFVNCSYYTHQIVFLAILIFYLLLFAYVFYIRGNMFHDIMCLLNIDCHSIL